MEVGHSDLKMSRALKQEDERGLSKLYESEFNKPDLHDKVLIFDVVALRRFSGASVEVNVSDENEEIENEASQEESGYETTKTENVETGVNTSDASQNCEIATKGYPQKFPNSSNEDNDLDIGTASNEYETQETEVTNKHETVPNENVETNENTSDGNKMEGHHESEISRDENNAYPDLNHNKQSEREISSESNEEISYPSSEKHVIREHKFYIHGAWLALQSSYFRSLFFSGMKESNVKEVHVQISTSEEQAHLMLLEAMYKIDTLDNASVDELLEVLRLAHKYDVKFVFKKCKYCLQAAVDSLDICEEIMYFIKIDNEITDVEDLVSTLQSFLAEEFSPLDIKWKTTSFKDLCEPSLKYLLSSDKLVTASENTVFHALMCWINKHGIENVLESQELPSLLSVVRFELMPMDYLYNIVQHHPVAKKLPDFNDHYLRGLSYHALPRKIREILPNQPVRRIRQDINTYTVKWTIPRDELDALIGTDKEVKTQTWYCGYRMVLRIDQVEKIDDVNRRDNKVKTFKANLTLEITNLKQHSVVDISWHPYSKVFSYGHSNTTYTFKSDAPSTSVNIEYRMKNLQQVLAPKLATAPGGAFGSPQSGFVFQQPTAFPLVQRPAAVASTPASRKVVQVPKEENEATLSLSIAVAITLMLEVK